jgi:nucleotide-binding universal stress UspA family protein
VRERKREIERDIGMTYNRILVPYDKCKAADKALEHALALAKSIESKEVILVHVVREILLPAMMTSHYHLLSSRTGETISPHEYLKEIYQEIKANSLEMLEKVKEKSQHAILSEPTDEDRKKQAVVPSPPLPPRSIAKIRTKVLLGRPQDKIIQYAKEERVDLIVIGNVCLRGLSRAKALGSISRDVAERSTCPVLIVH